MKVSYHSYHSFLKLLQSIHNVYSSFGKLIFKRQSYYVLHILSQPVVIQVVVKQKPAPHCKTCVILLAQFRYRVHSPG